MASLNRSMRCDWLTALFLFFLDRQKYSGEPKLLWWTDLVDTNLVEKFDLIDN